MIEKIVESITGMSAEELKKKSDEMFKQNKEFQETVVAELKKINANLERIADLLTIMGGLDE